MIVISIPAEAVTLGMTWLFTFFVVYVFIAHRLGFGMRGVMAGINIFHCLVPFHTDKCISQVPSRPGGNHMRMVRLLRWGVSSHS